MFTTSDYQNQVDGKKCISCKSSLLTGPVEHYDHPGGYNVEGYSQRQWLYVTCDNCEYQNALHKLGIANVK